MIHYVHNGFGYIFIGHCCWCLRRVSGVCQECLEGHLGGCLIPNKQTEKTNKQTEQPMRLNLRKASITEMFWAHLRNSMIFPWGNLEQFSIRHQAQGITGSVSLESIVAVPFPFYILYIASSPLCIACGKGLEISFGFGGHYSS